MVGGGIGRLLRGLRAGGLLRVPSPVPRGEGGGQVVAKGTPEFIATQPQSETGKYLAPLLKKGTAPVNQAGD